MGEGGHKHRWWGSPGRRPEAEPAGRRRRVPQACAGAGIALSTKPRAGQRAALDSARSYPPPTGRRSQRPCQAEAGEAASRTPPGSQTPARQRRGRGGRRFVVRHNSADPALPGQKFCAPHLSSQGPLSSPILAPRCPPARRRHPSRGLAARRAQTLPSAPKGPAASAAPEPGTRPSWEGRSGIRTHSPSPAASHPAVGEGAASPPFHGAPSPVPAPRLGRVPAPNTLRKPGKKCWARRDRRLGLPTLTGPHPPSPAAAAPPWPSSAGREERRR